MPFLNERNLLGQLREDSKDISSLLVTRRERKLADPSVLMFREYLRSKMTEKPIVEDDALTKAKKKLLEIQFGRAGNVKLKDMFLAKEIYTGGRIAIIPR